ncbi:MAG: ABC transporter permease [Phycisphaeraceae bacterium]|nr:ABC transporter permease [Phycisphaeraceae bacterium]
MAERAASSGTSAAQAPQAISGIEAMRGVGAQRARGFWADAWDRVLRTRTAVAALVWIGAVALLAVIAPLIANAQPLWLEHLQPVTRGDQAYSPLWRSLTATDLLLLFGSPIAILVMWLPLKTPRSIRLGSLIVLSVLSILAAASFQLVLGWIDTPGRSDEVLEFRRWLRAPESWWRPILLAYGVMLPLGAVASLLPFTRRWWSRAACIVLALAGVAIACGLRTTTAPTDYDALVMAEARGEIRTISTLIPWSPDRTRSELITVAPGRTVADAFRERLERLDDSIDRARQAAARAEAANRRLDLMRAEDHQKQLARQRSQLEREWERIAETSFAQRRFILGTDSNGVDVLCQLIWACRLSLSVGFVSTGIALLIGITLGALMGYFGGWIDLLLFRVVEIFMAMPVLFLLIVAAGVLPRNTYVMMAIIGCVSWTGAARFTRAEFLKLRGQDFVQSCRAVGLPLPSILFKHMLPNGVTPVLVDASFAIAAAILAEATLSFLGLGPDDQASWGKLLASATGSTGTFLWWLAIFPGLVIFLSVLSYNVMGGALRDAIDPKLRKAAH